VIIFSAFDPLPEIKIARRAGFISKIQSLNKNHT
jgi:hypothetical protein